MKTVTETCDVTSGPCAGEITKMKNAAAALRAKLDQAQSAGSKTTTLGGDPVAQAKAAADAAAKGGAGATPTPPAAPAAGAGAGATTTQ